VNYTKSPQIEILHGRYSLVSDWSGAKSIRYHWRCWWNPTPGAALLFNGKEYTLNSKNLILVPPHTPIKHLLRKPVESLALHISMEYPQPPRVQKIYEIPVCKSISAQLTKIQNIHDINTKNKESYNNQYEFSLLCLVNMVFQTLPNNLWNATSMDSRIRDCIQKLKSNFKSNHSNDTLSKKASMSTSSFIRLFKNEYGKPPQTCLQNIRLDQSALLLQQSNLTLEAIAEACGFCDRNYMSKLFKRRFSIGPASYRIQGRSI
jgi:AraC-like DNA-binding protein